jgi:transposase-like protein
MLEKCVYTLLGFDLAGKQGVLGLWIKETEGAHFCSKKSMISRPVGVLDISSFVAMG